jgi:hypothetical protein
MTADYLAGESAAALDRRRAAIFGGLAIILAELRRAFEAEQQYHDLRYLRSGRCGGTPHDIARQVFMRVYAARDT